MANITFIIGDKSYLIRKGLASVISKIPSTRIIYSIDNKEETLEALKNNEFDFAIINPELLSNNKIYTSRPLSKAQFIALTNTNQKLPEKINWVETIYYYDTQSTILKKINQLIGDKQAVKKKHQKHEEISNREAGILKYIALGYTNKEIADKLFISTHTVVTHRKNITRKLDIKTVPGLTIYAILNKIIDINDTK
ncbi:MAG: LuxR C-terminal-related transcriptional regulator [Bacteroidales bacterium]